MALPTIVDDITTAYLDAVDIELGGLVEGLYLVGSVALGDFRPRSSDIDFVAVTADRPAGAALAGLRHVHTRLHRRWPRPFFDGTYVTWRDLAADPARAGAGPYTHEGRFHPPGSTGGHTPVTWHMLARHGIAVRGPRPATLAILVDPQALAAWTDTNLDSYWRPWLARAGTPRTPAGWYALTPYAAVWLVTGVSRLHYTLTTGEITSKEDAGRYALATFPTRWHPLIRDCLRIRGADRAGSGILGILTAAATEYLRAGTAAPRPLYRTPVARRRDVLAFGAMAIADAHRVYQQVWAPGRR
jgi:hypothetical protein